MGKEKEKEKQTKNTEGKEEEGKKACMNHADTMKANNCDEEGKRKKEKRKEKKKEQHARIRQTQ